MLEILTFKLRFQKKSRDDETDKRYMFYKQIGS